MKSMSKYKTVRLFCLFTLLFTLVVDSYGANTHVTSAQSDPYAEQDGISVSPGPAVPLPSGEGSERNFRPPVPVEGTIPSKHIQYGPVASSSYLVWVDQTVALNALDDVESRLADNSADIMAKQLGSNVSGAATIGAATIAVTNTSSQLSSLNAPICLACPPATIAVTNAPGQQTNPAISGSIVAWETRADQCMDCTRDILAKDLATGATYNVATGPNDQGNPAIDGTTVAWIEDDSTMAHLRFADINSSQVYSTDIATFPYAQGVYVQAPMISSEYIAWAEYGTGAADTNLHTASVKAYNRATHSITVVATYQQSEWAYPQYALDGHNLIWDQGGLRLDNLNTGSQSVLFTGGSINSPKISGDTVVWSMVSLSSFCRDIYGLKLSDPNHTAKPLKAGAGCADVAVIAGDFLAWQNTDGTDDGTITTASVANTFAGSDAEQAKIDNQVPQERSNNNWPMASSTETGDAPSATPVTSAPNSPPLLYWSKGIHTSNGTIGGWLQPDGQACNAEGMCPAIDAIKDGSGSPLFGSFIFLTSDLDTNTTLRGNTIMEPGPYGPQVKFAVRELTNRGKHVTLRYIEPGHYAPQNVRDPDPSLYWSPARYAIDITTQYAWRSWLRNIVVGNEPNNDREWLPICPNNCTWTGAARPHSWRNNQDPAFYEAVRDFYIDLWYNLNFYRTDYNYCHNVDPARCNNLRNTNIWTPPLAPIEGNLTGGKSPYDTTLLEPMVQRYNFFSYNLYPSPKRHTAPYLNGILNNFTWGFFSTWMKQRIAITAGQPGYLPSQIQEFGWDPGDTGACPDPTSPKPGGGYNSYNQQRTWLATNSVNSSCNSGDRIDHALDTDIVNFIDTGQNGERHNALRNCLKTHLT